MTIAASSGGVLRSMRWHKQAQQAASTNRLVGAIASRIPNLQLSGLTSASSPKELLLAIFRLLSYVHSKPIPLSVCACYRWMENEL